MAPHRLLPWPPLPDVVAQQLTLIDAEETEESDDDTPKPPPDVHPETGEVLEYRIRPWDLSMLSDVLEAEVWNWLDDVVQWLNHAYGWQDEQVIPACWPLHEGLAHDLAQLAFGRVDAYRTGAAAYVGRWHSDWEDFQRRMAASLGLEGGRDCRRGTHKRPGQYAVDHARNEISRGRRKAERRSAVGET